MSNLLCISGEFITDLARRLFWEEDKDYKEVEAILLECFGDIEMPEINKRVLIQDIIEGKKKLVGDNVLTIEEDGENIRLMSERYALTEREMKIKELKEKMYYGFINYVDPFSTCKSIRAPLSLAKIPYTYEECVWYFWYAEVTDMQDLEPDRPLSDELIVLGTTYEHCRRKKYPRANQDTLGGLWLYEYPEIAYDAIQISGFTPSAYQENRAFWQAVYDIIKDRPDFQSEEFQERNRKFLRYHKTTAEEILAFLHRHDNDELEEEKDYTVIPDDMKSWTGLIAPNGDFYSCDYSNHNILAQKLLTKQTELFPNITASDLEYVNEYPDRALDVLLAQGWCATRQLPNRGEYVDVPTDGIRVKKMQKETIRKAMEKFNIQLDIDVDEL